MTPLIPAFLLVLFQILGCSDGTIRFPEGSSSFSGFPNNVLGPDSAAEAIAVLSDGRVLVGGGIQTYSDSSQARIAMVRTDGSIDTSFAIGSGFNGNVFVIAADTFTERIYVGGTFSQYQSSAADFIVAVKADGTRDLAFSVSSLNGAVRSIVPDGNGGVFVGGDFTSLGATARGRLVLLESNGTESSNFVVNAGFDGQVQDIALDGDKVLAAGAFLTYQGAGTGGRIVRLSSDGTRDVGFGYGGAIGAIGISVAVTANGSNDYYVTGNSPAIIERINSNGTLDGGFAAATAVSGQARHLALAGQGRVYVGGDFAVLVSTTVNGFARLNTNGSIDGTFASGNGFYGESVPRVLSFATTPNGKIVAGGFFHAYDTHGANSVVRVESNGLIDTSFQAVSGVNRSTFEGEFDRFGNFVLVGDFDLVEATTSGRVARFKSDGAFDSTFNTGSGFNALTRGVAISTADDKMYLVGQFTTFNGASHNRIVKLTSDGSLDGSFSSGTGFNATAEAVEILEGGDVLVGGAFVSYGGMAAENVARISPTGTLRAGFSSGTNQSVNFISITDDGSRFYLGGSFTTYGGTISGRIVRIDTTGTRDVGFNSTSGFNNPVIGMALARDGSGDIYAVGQFTSYGSTSRSRIARLNSDGTLDSDFAVGAGFSATANSIIALNDGDVLVGGTFSTYNGTASQRIIRLNSDGTVDGGFVGGLGGTVNYLVPIGDIGAIALGNFLRTTERTVSHFVALRTNGTSF